MKHTLVLAFALIASTLGLASNPGVVKEIQISSTTAGGWLMTDNRFGLGSCTSTGFCSPVIVTISEGAGSNSTVIDTQRLLFQTGPTRSGTLEGGAVLSGPGIVTVGTYFTGVFNGAIQWKLSNDHTYYLLSGKVLSTNGTNAKGDFAVRVAAPLNPNGRQRIQQVWFTFKLRTRQ